MGLNLFIENKQSSLYIIQKRRRKPSIELTVESLVGSLLFDCIDLSDLCSRSPSGNRIRASRVINECPLECEWDRWPFDCLRFDGTLFVCSGDDAGVAVSAADNRSESSSSSMELLVPLWLAKCCWRDGCSSELPLMSKLMRVRFLAVSMFWRPY